MSSREEAAFWGKAYKPSTDDSGDSEDDVPTPVDNHLQNHLYNLRRTRQASQRVQKRAPRAHPAANNPAFRYFAPSVTLPTPVETADQTGRTLFESAPSVPIATTNLVSNQAITTAFPARGSYQVCRNSLSCQRARTAASTKQGIHICLCYEDKSTRNRHTSINQIGRSGKRAETSRLVRHAKPTLVEHFCRLVSFYGTLCSFLFFAIIFIRWYYGFSPQVVPPAVKKL